MPYYQFTIPTGGATLQHKAEVAAAMTEVHGEVTGAAGAYVYCSFVEVSPESIFAGGEPVSGSRMVGIIRQGRSTEVKAKLIHGLADAWCEITGDPEESVAIFLQEIPGANALEDGVILPEITDERGAIY
jgi:phenylpyruvate tautomerase PptA (4-oxalocrotonate tautomerase family)